MNKVYIFVNIMFSFAEKNISIRNPFVCIELAILIFCVMYNHIL